MGLDIVPLLINYTGATIDWEYLVICYIDPCSKVDQCNCVVTVPLDYTEVQRNIIKNCAIKAGFTVTQVISEPAAACLAYGLGQDDISERYHCLVSRLGT